LNGEQALLEVIEVREAGRTRVLLRGELDVAGVPMVNGALQRLSERRERVVLDFDELTLIDMRGLRMVLQARADAARDGSTFSVTPGSPAVRRLISLVDLGERPPFDGSSR
jgi:anti-anti-sigma factor